MRKNTLKNDPGHPTRMADLLAAAVKEASELATPGKSSTMAGSVAEGKRDTMSVTARTILSEQGIKDSNFSSLAEIKSSCIQRVIASVRRTTSS